MDSDILSITGMLINRDSESFQCGETMLKIMLLGSTGRVGRVVLEKALALGHSIIILVRNKNKVAMSHENLTIIEGDVYHDDVFRELEALEFDVVINCIGSGTTRPSTLITDTAAKIVTLLSTRPTTRYIAITGVSQMKQRLFGKLFVTLLKKSPVRHAIIDHQGAFDLIVRSNLDWTFIACPWIQDGKERGKYRSGLIFSGRGTRIHPGDVATALVNELDKEDHQKIIGIWY